MLATMALGGSLASKNSMMNFSNSMDSNLVKQIFDHLLS